MTLCAADFTSIKGVCHQDPDSAIKAVFTKECKLRRSVGSAQKDWQLVCLAGSDDQLAGSLGEARSAILDLVKHPTSKTSKRFTFARRTTGCILFLRFVFEAPLELDYAFKNKTLLYFLSNLSSLTPTLSIVCQLCQWFVNFVNGSSIVRQWQTVRQY